MDPLRYNQLLQRPVYTGNPVDIQQNRDSRETSGEEILLFRRFWKRNSGKREGFLFPNTRWNAWQNGMWMYPQNSWNA